MEERDADEIAESYYNSKGIPVRELILECMKRLDQDVTWTDLKVYIENKSGHKVNPNSLAYHIRKLLIEKKIDQEVVYFKRYDY